MLFTLNFTITNLKYEEDMPRPGSRKFNTTERVLQSLVSALPSLLCQPQISSPFYIIDAKVMKEDSTNLTHAPERCKPRPQRPALLIGAYSSHLTSAPNTQTP